MLAGALCIAAVVAAVLDRRLAAGVLLRLALGTKEWTLLAVIPTLAACRERRLKVLAVATAVGAPLALGMALADPGAFLHSARGVGDLRQLTDTTWWWPLSHIDPVTAHVNGSALTTAVHSLPLGLTRSQVAWLAPLAALVIAWAYHRRPGTRDRADALGLLALLLLLRCTLDPISMLYYHVPLVIAVVAWEAITGRGLPLVSLTAIAALWWTYSGVTDSSGQRATVYIITTAGLAAYLLVRVLVRRTATRAARTIPAVA
jgi:hypothetical protein